MSVRAFSDVVAGSTSVAFLKGGDRNPPLRFFQINTKISCGKSEEVLKIPENSPNKWNIKIREISSNLSLYTYRKKILDSFVSQCLQYLRFHPKVTVYAL